VLPKRHKVVLPKHSFVQDTVKGITVKDYKLIIAYLKVNPRYSRKEYEEYETNYLIRNKYFLSFYETLLYNVYVYTLDHVKSDVDLFLKGSYSKFSQSTKNKILDYYSYVDNGVKTYHSKIIKMLNPTDEEFKKLAEALDEDFNVIKDLGEIVTKPSIEKETLDDILVK
jgi:hypothetical protein